MNFTFKDLEPVEFLYPSNKLTFKNSKVSFNNGLQSNMYDFFADVKDMSVNQSNILALTPKCYFTEKIVAEENTNTAVELYLLHIDNESFLSKSSNAKYIECSFKEKSKFSLIRSNDFNNETYYVLIDEMYIVVDKNTRTISLKSINLVSNLSKEEYNFNIRFLEDNKCTIQSIGENKGYLTVCKGILSCRGMYIPYTNYDTSYIFKYIKIYENNIDLDLNSTNNWVSYHMSLKDRNNNNNLEILNQYKAPTEYLLSFNVDDISDKRCTLDALTLKTNFFSNNIGGNIPNSIKNKNDTTDIHNNYQLVFGTDSVLNII
jgi:hypothetical protein